MVEVRAVHHGNGYEAALGKNHVGLDRADDLRRLGDALDHAEGIGKILGVKVAAQLAHRYAVVFHARQSGNQLLFHTVCRANVVHFPAVLLQTGNQRQIRRHMTAGTAACHYNFFHGSMFLQGFRVYNFIHYSTGRTKCFYLAVKSSFVLQRNEVL